MSHDQIAIQRALFSVSDKSGLVPLAQGMLEINPLLQIISTGGTANVLMAAKLPFVPLSEKTKSPEYFNGRIKTLHPAILGGILYRRGIDEKEALSLQIEPIDLIVCNLYPFEKASQDLKMEMSELVDSMDIGGSSLIRSGCKNFFSVAVVVDPADYPSILEELAANRGTLSLKTRENLAVKAMQLSAAYEAFIASQFAKRLQKNDSLHLNLEGGRKLRYGENPDQEGWVYSFQEQKGIAASKVLMGKELSYNNYEDASQGFFAVQRLYQQQGGNIAAIVKHGGLCGFATGPTIHDAFEMAWNGDTKSAFGSIVALTQPVDDDFRDGLKDRFIEMILAPSFTDSFVEWALATRPSLRLLQISLEEWTPMLYRTISGGLLVQTPKKDLYSSLEQFFVPIEKDGEQPIGVATKRMPNPEQIGLFRFAIAAVQSVKSNAIVIAREYSPGFYQLIGVGGGQPNRIDSMQKLACPKAIENLQKMVGEKKVEEALGQAVLVSDGFFPFADAITLAAEYGIKTCLQPGGSIRDREVIQAADQHDLCMIFTGQRYFNH
ncbi:MAG: bifunctional phosphoribosylaminoimidazolecarboxamide formyltransferase/IMP cyclohydrolase [Rhabdochlamydiaceae bacterium]